MIYKGILNYGEVYTIFLKDGAISYDVGIYLGLTVLERRRSDRTFYLFYIDGNIKYLDPFDYQFYNINDGVN